jgi:hypothetical protein
MPEPTIEDFRAELEWRLAQAPIDRDERARNKARIRELDRQIAELNNPRPDPLPQPNPNAFTMLVTVLALFGIFFLLLSL